jgi:hypothetical protein
MTMIGKMFTSIHLLTIALFVLIHCLDVYDRQVCKRRTMGNAVALHSEIRLDLPIHACVKLANKAAAIAMYI